MSKSRGGSLAVGTYLQRGSDSKNYKNAPLSIPFNKETKIAIAFIESPYHLFVTGVSPLSLFPFPAPVVAGYGVLRGALLAAHVTGIPH